ncbi:4a-hydroxytetrahydrobiopterin dehydratase [Sporichthya polymorpha]|uniref:4a-hydroxytetrahydrobiopterin dehydratase n=1 Tax=Sporichthya polymorpha TaxID=35751 RepID=UPI00035D552D|nr:4a-hydroxytetrahydrobiopterin dehydratase [Sporichthya polymorpha]
MVALLSEDDVAAGLADLNGWTGDTTEIRRSYAAPDFPTAIRLVDAVAVAAEEMDHHPDMDIRWRTVHFTISTHSAGGVTELDLTLARKIDEAAAGLGAA